MVISAVYNQARILQAHLAGSNIVIRKSAFLDLNTLDMGPYDVLTRWMANTPIGDTKSPARYVS